MMDHDETYQKWKCRRAEAAVPAGFADRVMRAVAAHESRPDWRAALAEFLPRLLAWRPARVGMCTLAVLVCVLRMLSALAIFVAQVSVAE